MNTTEHATNAERQQLTRTFLHCNCNCIETKTVMFRQSLAGYEGAARYYRKSIYCMNLT